ncbi:FAD-dependent oxidoreductase, partial [Aduncisulcus paluster]
KVIVVGGGNTAIDAARTCIRFGCEVTLLYRRTRNEMPANVEEIIGAEDEGVKYVFLSAPTKVIIDDKGKATHLECIRMELGEPDESGRRRPVPVAGTEERYPVDTIISAIGQNLSFPAFTLVAKSNAILTSPAGGPLMQTRIPCKLQFLWSLQAVTLFQGLIWLYRQ